jgi:hypothetical protein
MDVTIRSGTRRLRGLGLFGVWCMIWIEDGNGNKMAGRRLREWKGAFENGRGLCFEN